MRFEIFVILMVGVILAAGCISESEKITPELVKDRTLMAVTNASSYSFKMVMEMTIKGEGLEGGTEAVLRIFGEGDVDLANRKSRLALEMENPQIPGGTPEGVNTTLYFIGDTAYMEVFKTWISQRIENVDDVWSRQNQVQIQSELLQDAKLELLADEEIDGEAVYVLRVTPDKLKVLRYMMEQSKTNDFSSLSETELSAMSENLGKFSVTQWIRKDDYLPIRFKTLMEMSTDNSTVTMDMDMSISNYNKEFIIEPPSDAIDFEQMVSAV
ncbi:MAG: DUF6612 family protein [Candidatus Altiarchaeota archaeon]